MSSPYVCTGSGSKAAGYWGDYNCDIPFHTLENLFQYLATIKDEVILIWLTVALPATRLWHSCIFFCHSVWLCLYHWRYSSSWCLGDHKRRSGEREREREREAWIYNYNQKIKNIVAVMYLANTSSLFSANKLYFIFHPRLTVWHGLLVSLKHTYQRKWFTQHLVITRVFQ